MIKRINKSHNLSTLHRKKSSLSDKFSPENSDILGSYTGNSSFEDSPEQDADDL